MEHILKVMKHDTINHHTHTLPNILHIYTPPPLSTACVLQISLQESRADEAVKFDFAIVFAERQMNDGKIVIGGEWYDRKTRKVYHFDKIVNRIEKAGCYVQIYRSKAKTKLKTSKKDPPQDKCHYVIVEIGCR